MSWAEAALWWLPTATVVAMTGFGLVALIEQAWRPSKKYWIAAFVVCGVLAIAASASQQWLSRVAVLGRDRAQLAEVTAHLDKLGRLLVAEAGTAAHQTFDTIASAIAALNAKVVDLESQIQALQEKSRNRTIDTDTSGKLAEHLRQFGSHRVVVSCVPGDVEAYTYANQIANALHAAGWEALGPQTTTIFGEAPAMGVTLYVRGGAAAPEAARLLIDAFGRFNIPYQSGVAASDAIPDPETVELFVARKP